MRLHPVPHRFGFVQVHRRLHFKLRDEVLLVWVSFHFLLHVSVDLLNLLCENHLEVIVLRLLLGGRLRYWVLVDDHFSLLVRLGS